MSTNPANLLQSKFINGWNLFWLITVPISTVMVYSMMSIELTSARAVSSMFELSFAAAMAWQLFFILWMLTQYTEYYVEKVYALSDLIEGVGGYLLLTAMVLTTFKFGRSRLTARQWKVLHKVGIYWLWLYIWIAYWWYLFYYNKPVTVLAARCRSGTHRPGRRCIRFTLGQAGLRVFCQRTRIEGDRNLHAVFPLRAVVPPLLDNVRRLLGPQSQGPAHPDFCRS